ncbi:uncharacterized protein LOC144114846 isoform X2 [Amblyomma americanum]
MAVVTGPPEVPNSLPKETSVVPLQAPLLCGCCCFPGSAISSPSGAAARSSFPPASWPCLADTSFYTWQRGSSASSDIGDAYKSKPGTTHLGHSTVTAMEILPLRILQTILLTFTASRLYVRYLALHPAAFSALAHGPLPQGRQKAPLKPHDEGHFSYHEKLENNSHCNGLHINGPQTMQ